MLTTTYCNNPLQKSSELRLLTKYNSACQLFEERAQDFYGADKNKSVWHNKTIGDVGNELYIP